MGIWDLNVSPMSLGGLLILVEELKILCEVHQACEADLCVVVDGQGPVISIPSWTDNRWAALTDSDSCKDAALLSVATGVEGIGTCFLAASMDELRHFMHHSGCSYVSWPPLSPEGTIDHQYGYSLFVQEYYRKQGRIPLLRCKADPIRWAVRFLKTHVAPSVPVAVHLKNKLRGADQRPDWYNAIHDEWHAFFQAAYDRYDIRFVLVGDDAIPERIRALPNVIVAQDWGGELLRDLALIQTAFAFMGVASGPAQMAIFGEAPYVIYKNPEHHIELMNREMGSSDRFVFSQPFQKLLRQFETRESILHEFDHIYAHTCRTDWANALEKLESSLAYAESDKFTS